MQRAARTLPRLLALHARGAAAAESSASQPSAAWAAWAAQQQQVRYLGGDKVPQYWGRPSPYTEGTGFLGTPRDHMSLVGKRPLSPDVLEVDGKSLHYKMPWAALSSITNRATGTALSVGFAAAGYVALTGDLPSALAALRADAPAAAFLARLVIALPLVYHYLGGVRHFVWDLHKIGNQADKSSLLEVPKVEASSKLLFGASAVLGVLLAAAG